MDAVQRRREEGIKALNARAETPECELLHQLELQRQYLDFLASSVEYLAQELGTVKYLLQASHQSGSISSGILGQPCRPAQLGESPRSGLWNPHGL